MALPSSRCKECPLFFRLRYHVPATKVKGAKMALVGEAPGQWEVANKRPFVGPAGKLLDTLLKLAGINRKEVTASNVLKCQPEKNKLPADLSLAIACCSEILEKDLEEVETVIGLGNVPLLALTKQSLITKRRGSIYKIAHGRTFIGTLHPAALLRSSFVKGEDETKVLPKEVVVADLVKALAISEGYLWQKEENFIIEPLPNDSSSFLQRLQNPKAWVALDIETSWSKIREAVPLIIAFSFEDVTLCAEFKDEGLDWIAQALASPAPKITHNGIFDIAVLRNVGFEVENWAFDTLYAHHLMYAELPHSLGFVQSLYTDLPFHKHLRDELEEGWDK